MTPADDYDGHDKTTRSPSHLVIGMDQPSQPPSWSDHSGQNLQASLKRNTSIPSTVARTSAEQLQILAGANSAALRSKTKRREAMRATTKEKKGYVSLTRVLLDCYEYKSFNELGVFMLFFLVATLFLFFQWGKQAAGFKNSVIQSMQSYNGNNPWEISSLDQIGKMEEGWDYMLGYLQNNIARTDSLLLDIQPTEVWVDEFAQIGYVRIYINFKQNCKAKHGRKKNRAFEKDQPLRPRLECLYDNPQDPDVQAFMQLTLNKTDYRKRPSPMANMTEGDWYNNILAARGRQVSSSDVYLTKPLGIWIQTERGWATTIVTRNDTVGLLSGRQGFLSYIDNQLMVSDGKSGFMRRLVGKYAYHLQLGMVAASRLGTDAAIFRMNVRLGEGNQKLVKDMGTSTINTGRDNRNAPLVWICHVAFVVLTLFYIRQEAQRWRISALEHRSMLVYPSQFWNVWEMLSQLCNIVWVVWFWIILTHDPREFPRNVRTYEKMDHQSDLYTSWLYFGILVINLLGVSMCRFMRVHLGLRAFYQMFHDAFKHVVDFAVFVLYLILVLGIATFAFFQLSGGNSLFVTYSNGLNALARVGFNLIDYQDFQADAAGVNTRWKWTVSMMFWLSVILLTVFVQNTLIAIISYAYERAREKTAQVEHSFITLIIFRWGFLFRYLMVNFVLEMVTYLDEWRHRNDKDLGHRGLFINPKYTLPSNILMKYKLNARDPENMFGFTAQAARFSCARLRECHALVNMCTDFASLKLAHDGDPGWRRLVGSGKEVDPLTYQGHILVMPRDDANYKGFVDPKVDEVELAKLLHMVRLKHNAWLPQTTLGRLFFGLGPLRGVNEEDIQTVVKLLMEVYEHVEGPTIDEDEDGVDDDRAGQQVAELRNEVAELKAAAAAQTQLIGDLISAIRGQGLLPYPPGQATSFNLTSDSRSTDR